MKRLFLLQVRELGEVSMWAETRHKAKAEVARDLIANGRASNFKEACNYYIPICRLAPGQPGACEPVERGAGALGAEESILSEIFEVLRDEAEAEEAERNSSLRPKRP